MAQYRSIRDFDWSLIALSLILCGLGLLQIYSATLGTRFEGVWLKQVMWLGLALVALWVISSVDYHTLLGQVPLLYTLTILGLITTFLLGKLVWGGRRWLSIGGFNFQISEFAKIVIILLVARYLSELRTEDLEWRDLLKLGGLVGLPLFLVLAQPDLGTSLTFLPVVATGVLLAGLRWKYVAVLVLLAGLAVPLAWPLLKDYQKARLTAFVDPTRDPRGSGYQVIQSKIAVGSGGMWGKGVTRGTQTHLQFLPVSHTDFVFSSFAEEHGFVGVIVVLGLYFLLLMQVVQNAQTASDRAGVYVCMGVASVLLFHLLVNVGMVVGRMPVTGIPLPLMSYGGSHLLSVFMMLGLVNNVRLRRFVN
jgi:rod shape determining protein RodA